MAFKMYLLTGVLFVMIIRIEVSFAAPEIGLEKMDDFTHDIARRSVKECTTGCHHPYRRGNLDINISRAWGLEDKDILTGKQSDPYVVVTAVKDSSLIEVTLQTSAKKNTHDPHWNEILSFGCGYLKFIEVSIEDRDDGKDDNLLLPKKFTICEEDAPVCFEEYVTTDKGKLKFEIRFTPDGNDCYPNPCYNGGTCREYSCSGYYCSCPTGYTGKRCEQKAHYNGGGGGSPGTGGSSIDDPIGVMLTDEGFN